MSTPFDLITIAELLIVAGLAFAVIFFESLQGARWPRVATIVGPACGCLMLGGLAMLVLGRFP